MFRILEHLLYTCTYCSILTSRKLQDLSMDEFMSGAFDSSSSESEKKAKSVGKKNIKNKKNTYVPHSL